MSFLGNLFGGGDKAPAPTNPVDPTPTDPTAVQQPVTQEHPAVETPAPETPANDEQASFGSMDTPAPETPADQAPVGGDMPTEAPASDPSSFGENQTPQDTPPSMPMDPPAAA